MIARERVICCMMQEVIADILDKWTVMRKQMAHRPETNRLTASAMAIFITSCRCAVNPHSQSTVANNGTTVIKSLAIKIANEIIHADESGVALIRENNE